MKSQQRLSNLERVERETLLAQIEVLENHLYQRMTDDQLEAVIILLGMQDREWRGIEDAEKQQQLLAKRRQESPIQELKEDVNALQWANQQFEKYEASKAD